MKARKSPMGPRTLMDVVDRAGSHAKILMREIVAIEHTEPDTTRILLRGGGSISLLCPTEDVIEIWKFCLRTGRSKPDRVLCKVTWGSAT